MKHLLLIFSATFLFGYQTLPAKVPQQNSSEKTLDNASIHQEIQQLADAIFDSLVLLRRDFHRHPELSGQEQRTSEKVADYLKTLGLDVKTGIGGFGVVGTLKGALPGKKVAWRADMDAMPSDTKDAVAFESVNPGVRHICGHDVHITVTLGLAQVLAAQKEKLAGTVYFVFQPSEENLQGAQAMLNDGLFNIIDPDEMYALHLTPFPAGTVATKTDELFAAYNKLRIRLKRGENSKELIAFTKEQIQQLQNIEPDSNFWNMENMGDPEIGIAGPNTIYKDFTIINGGVELHEDDKNVMLTAYLSSSDVLQRNAVVPFLRSKFSKSKYADALINIDYISETPTILNDKKLTRENLDFLTSIYGEEQVIPMTGVVADGRSDDFALFQEKAPTVYFFLGGSNFEKGLISQPHAPYFEVDERCINTGVKLFSSMLFERLKNN